MRILRKMVVALAPALFLVGLVGPTAQAAASPDVAGKHHAPAPSCVVHSNDEMVEMGGGAYASEIGDVIQVECRAVFGESYVTINATQLNVACHGTLTFFEPATGSLVYGSEFTGMLDDDGNLTVLVFGGPSCAAGTTNLITADLRTPPYYTATTTFHIDAPHNTHAGVYATPATEVEDSTYSSVGTVVQVEYPSVYAGQTVTVTDTQLAARCFGGITWFSPSTGLTYTGDTAFATLDNNGNAFLLVYGTGCASGDTLVTADVMVPTYRTYTTTFRVLSPRVTI